MSQHDQASHQPSLFPFVVIAAIGLVAFIVAGLSNAFGTDVATGWQVFRRLAVVAAVVIACMLFGDDLEFLKFKNSWPVLLMFVVGCFWPVVHYRAELMYLTTFVPAGETVWWDSWPTKVAVMVGIPVFGYLIRHGIRSWYDQDA
jgi:uncharacterized membrane protein